MSIYEEFLKKGHKTRPIYDFRELVYSSKKDFSELPAFVMRDRTVSYKELADNYRALCSVLLKQGYKDKRIAVVGQNSYGWILAYLASATVGVVVPIDKELSVGDMLDFMHAADCSAVFADDSILNQMQDENVEKIAISKSKSHKLLQTVIDEGDAIYKSGYTEIDTMPINNEEMSILIFTSGTTGNSKGVCLSQKNICANINQTARMVKVDKTLHSLSVLPLHHTYETTLGHLLLLSGGSCISYCDGLRHVAKNISEYRPSVLIVVPLLLEFMLKRIDASIRKSLPAKMLPPEGTPLTDMINGLPALIRFVVKRKVKKSLGGRLRLLIVGAAPIKQETIESFMLLGITTYQGYGLTECSPLIAGNNDFYMNPAAVGLPIHGVEIKIENPNNEGVGEIVAKGDNIMLGYYNAPEETAEVMRNGYFHTGDLGRFDEDGFLYVTGRCKNVIVAQNGKNIYPEELETRLNEESYISESLVLGTPNSKGGTAVKAKLFPDLDKIKELYGGILPDEKTIRELVASAVSRVNDVLPTYKKITVTEIVWEAFEKTTTKKIKRFGNNVL